MYGSLPTEQKVHKVEIKGIHSKAILCEYTLVVPYHIMVYGG
jgi:hypothetical protein